MIEFKTKTENYTISELLSIYGSIDNIPLNVVVKLCSAYNLVIKGLGNGKVKRIRELEV